MSDVINLNKFRKRKKLADKETLAAGNRAKFGRTKAEKARDESASVELKHHLDRHKQIFDD